MAAINLPSRLCIARCSSLRLRRARRGRSAAELANGRSTDGGTNSVAANEPLMVFFCRSVICSVMNRRRGPRSWEIPRKTDCFRNKARSYLSSANAGELGARVVTGITPPPCASACASPARGIESEVTNRRVLVARLKIMDAGFAPTAVPA